MMSGFEWGMGVGGWLWMGVGIVLIVLVVLVLVAALGQRARRPDEDASEILKVRFARGEITEAEYEQARHLLAK